MSDSSSANSNSWTLLATEENVAETLRPVAEGIENQTDILDPATVEPTGERGDGKGAVPAERERSEESWQAPQEVTGSQEVDLERVEDAISHVQHNTSDATDIPNLTPDPAHDSHMTPDPTSVKNDHLPSSLEIPAPSHPDVNAASQLAGSSEGQAHPSPDPDSFSESYTHISPSVEDGPGFLLTETLGAEEEVKLIQEGEAVHQLNGEGLEQEEEESELSQRVTEDGKQAVPSEVGEEWPGDWREESSGVRRRRGSLLAALERIGRRDEEEEEPEAFHLPQREEETGFSLNKCILGAIILLGLGTIFFSGVFMDLDEEGEYDVREMRDAEVTGKHEWLNPEVPPPPVDVDNPELLNKPCEENQHISVLQAQLQAQKEELKVAQGQAAEGAKERVRREEVEKENGRLKKDALSLPVLLKENEKMKRDLASVPALQREVERLRATVTELKHIPACDTTPPPVTPAAAPPPGPVEDGSLKTDSPAEEEVRTLRVGEGKEKKKKEWKKDEPGQGEQGKERWKEQGEKKLREGGKEDWKPEKEWKKGKRDKESDGQGGKKREEKKGWKGKEEKTGEWKKERESRGDEGKPWKNKEERKEGRGKNERKDWKKGENAGDGKEWKGKSEIKEKKAGKRYVDGNEGEHEGKGGEDWRHQEDWGERHQDKGEKKQWKGDKDWKKKDGGREWKGEEKQRSWQGKEKEWPREGDRKKEWPREGDRKKEWPREGDRKKEWPREGDRKKERLEDSWRQERGSHHRGKDEHKQDKHEKRPHGFTEREGGKESLRHSPGEKGLPPTHRSPPLEQPNYWLLQRERLQHNPSPQAKCTSVETCAQAEGLLPVPLPEFEALLLGYLAKAEGVGVEASRREELRKLATEFFKDGVFAHDHMSFRDFVEDLGDILEDMVDGEEDEDEEEGGIEEEMDGFDDEAMRKFAVLDGGEKVEKKRDERMKEAGRSHG